MFRVPWRITLLRIDVWMGGKAGSTPTLRNLRLFLLIKSIILENAHRFESKVVRVVFHWVTRLKNSTPRVGLMFSIHWRQLALFGEMIVFVFQGGRQRTVIAILQCRYLNVCTKIDQTSAKDNPLSLHHGWLVRFNPSRHTAFSSHWRNLVALAAGQTHSEFDPV